jgi:hypothetical protein
MLIAPKAWQCKWQGGKGQEEHTPGVGVALCPRADSTTASRLPHDKGWQHHAASAAPLCSRVVIGYV